MYFLLLSLGLVVRLLLIPVSGFKADIAFWKGWGLAVTDKGIIWLVNNTNYNYPPGFAYILELIGKVYKLFADPYNIGQYWMDNNLLSIGYVTWLSYDNPTIDPHQKFQEYKTHPLIKKIIEV